LRNSLAEKKTRKKNVKSEIFPETVIAIYPILTEVCLFEIFLKTDANG